jgi:NADPH:quinone reductase-like Zn-dependent oxidoreductase
MPIPVPQQGELLVRVEAAGVAFADIMVREGRYPGVRAPVTPGYDMVGRIEEVGDGLEGWSKGDRVGALTVTGSYARHIVIPSEWAIRVPEMLDPGTAVSMILNYGTAWQMLWRNTCLGQGDTVVVHGAAGGVGTALLDLCRLRGVRAFGTASAAKHQLVAERGGVPIDYAREDFVVRVLDETDGRGADAAFDHLGGAHLKRSFAALGATGVLVSYGGLAAFRNGRTHLPSAVGMLLKQPRYAPLSLLLANKAVVGFDIAGRRKARPDWLAADLGELFALAAQGALTPVIAARIPLEQARDAHDLLGQGSGPPGKIILCT